MPVYRSKGYGCELAECQRYYRIVDNGNGYVSTSNAYIFLPGTMRATPTATVEINGSVRMQGDSVAVSAVSDVVMYKSSMRLTMPGTFKASNYAATLFNSVIALSADL